MTPTERELLEECFLFIGATVASPESRVLYAQLKEYLSQPAPAKINADGVCLTNSETVWDGQPINTVNAAPAPSAEVVHTDHGRSWDRTCPACAAEASGETRHAYWTQKLKEVGGLENSLVGIPADGVKSIIADLQKAES